MVSVDGCIEIGVFVGAAFVDRKVTVVALKMLVGLIFTVLGVYNCIGDDGARSLGNETAFVADDEEPSDAFVLSVFNAKVNSSSVTMSFSWNSIDSVFDNDVVSAEVLFVELLVDSVIIVFIATFDKLSSSALIVVGTSIGSIMLEFDWLAGPKF